MNQINSKLALKPKVQVVVIAEDELLLLQFNNIHNNGYQNITGSVEEDESFEEGARRELLEETGIVANVTNLEFEFNFFDQWKNNVIEKVFFAHLPKKHTIHISNEHQSYKWKKCTLVSSEDFVFPSNFTAFLKAWEKTKI